MQLLIRGYPDRKRSLTQIKISVHAIIGQDDTDGPWPKLIDCLQVACLDTKVNQLIRRGSDDYAWLMMTVL